MHALDERLRVAYSTALWASHAGGGSVEVHLGSDVIEHIRSMTAGASATTCWGYPLVEAAASDHISVHTVYTIA